MSGDTAARAREAFVQAWGAAPQLQVQAPGRVNLIGEHTDYNDGFVLPCAIDYATVIAASPRTDTLVRVVAADEGLGIDRFDLAAPIARLDEPRWTLYVRGMVQALREDGHALRGADLAVAGDIPQGAGLSSSASLEVAVGQAFKSLYGLDAIDPTRLAVLAQRAENDFVGVRCGIMDQLASARGRRGHALLIDCRSLETTAVPWPSDWAIMIIHSRVRRGLVDSEYNIRRRQCEEAARHFGVPALRDVELLRLERDAAGLDPVVLRRARHIVTENQRTLEAAQALRAADLPRLGELMAASHASMRDDFEITTPAVDALAALAHGAIGGEGGARMTGGGFGGCVVAVMPAQRVDEVRAAVLAGYRAPTGEVPWIWTTGSAAGAGPV